MQTFMVTPAMAQGFNNVFEDGLPENQQAKRASAMLAAFGGNSSFHHERRNEAREALAAFLQAEKADVPLEDMVALALAYANKGFYPLPCTAESAVGQRLQRAWDEWVTNHPDAAPYVKQFGWKFFNPTAVATDVALMAIVGETDLVPLDVIVH